MAGPDEPSASPRIPSDSATTPASEAVPTPGAALASDSSLAPSVPVALSPIADGVEHRLDPRFVELQRLVGWITWASISLPLFAVAAGVTIGARPPLWISASTFFVWGVVCLGLVWLARRWPELEHRHAAYRVDASGIEIRQGVVWRSVVSVARSRVQHTDVSQGPLERRYGLARLLIYTAGTDSAEVALPGLDHALALRIRDHLLAGGGDDAV